MTLQTKVKIFMGFLQNGELKMHLKQSLDWQRAKDLNEGQLLESQHQAREYIGVWIDPPIQYEDLQKTEREIRSRLQLYCPKVKLDSHLIYLFTQVFVS